MITDYKICYIQRKDNETEVKVRFFEGDFRDIEKNDKIVNLYARTAVLRAETLKFSVNITDREIRQELNKELAKDINRLPIDQQKNA